MIRIIFKGSRRIVRCLKMIYAIRTFLYRFKFSDDKSIDILK